MALKIEILPNQFYLNEDNTYDKEDSILLSGKVAGVCYDKEGFNHLKDEDASKTNRRVNMTLNNGHHSVYDHNSISLNITGIPKILAMVINNEKQYTTSEKSARYTKVVKDDTVISSREEELYNKWIEIFKIKIKEKYGDVHNDSKITKLAQENARYLVTVFMPTTMIYTTSFRQLNYIASWMKKYISNPNLNLAFKLKLKDAMTEFVSELDRLHILEDGLMQNEKDRSLSLFGSDLDKVEEYFGNVYATTYKASFAYLAQAQRHRTIDYQMSLLDEKEYFIPPIISDDRSLVSEWLSDISSVKDVTPQGELILISEMGTYDNFILKCKERLCSAAQLEIMMETRAILLKYKEELERKNSPLAADIKKYTLGARCTFKDFKCTSDCKFKEGKNLTREI